ncbi:MAG: tol-pal system protein YbgF [Acidobacteria bacterium]|nr:tol-pal system protein YbgF [Acidobacteriota bacterium]
MPQPTARFWLLAFLMAAAFQVPADAANREHQQMAADLRMLHEQNQLLQAQVVALADTLKTVLARIDDHNNLTRKGFADEKLQLDNISGDVRVVREKQDETNVRLSSLSQELEAVRLAIPTAVPCVSVPPAPGTVPAEPPAAGVLQPPAGTQPPTPTGTQSPPAPPVPPPPSLAGLHPERMYQTAWADYAAGQFQLAINGFEAFLKTFPKSDLAGEAQYYIGEALASQNRLKDAVAAYDLMIRNYPGAPRVPMAHYKRGVALAGLNETAQARESLEYVLKTFPESTAARLARQYLDNLRRD